MKNTDPYFNGYTWIYPRERTTINELLESYQKGYTNDDIDLIIDDNDWTEDDANSIHNPELRAIVQLSFSIYDDEEMEKAMENLANSRS